MVDGRAARRLEALKAKDAGFTWEPFTARVGLVFDTLQVAWSSQDWVRARPFVSDNLFQMQQYWIDEYRRQKLRNLTTGARVTGIELARVVSDRWYDAITVRLRATGPDYTVDEADHVVRGRPDHDRPYSEYWTFIRGTGVRGAARADKQCPNCGAALAINMAGNCESCQAKVTAGQFDWVLSRIEQDDTYSG